MSGIDDLDEISEQFRYGGNRLGRTISKRQRAAHRRARQAGAAGNQTAEKQAERSMNRRGVEAVIAKSPNRD